MYFSSDHKMFHLPPPLHPNPKNYIPDPHPTKKTTPLLPPSLFTQNPNIIPPVRIYIPPLLPRKIYYYEKKSLFKLYYFA